MPYDNMVGCVSCGKKAVRQGKCPFCGGEQLPSLADSANASKEPKEVRTLHFDCEIPYVRLDADEHALHLLSPKADAFRPARCEISTASILITRQVTGQTKRVANIPIESIGTVAYRPVSVGQQAGEAITAGLGRRLAVITFIVITAMLGSHSQVKLDPFTPVGMLFVVGFVALALLVAGGCKALAVLAKGRKTQFNLHSDKEGELPFRIHERETERVVEFMTGAGLQPIDSSPRARLNEVLNALERTDLPPVEARGNRGNGTVEGDGST